jgi:lipid-A-disaccharide synthase
MSSADAANPAGASRSEPLPGVLFTAFEPSGDEHAAVVIAELKRRYPGLPVFAWGGPAMEAAGATIIERTGEDAVMGLPGIGKILEHNRINGRVREWVRANPGVRLHVPVDSPAANFPLCRITRGARLGILHLVAPQIWAWGGWRIRKLRKLTDGLLCLLPFEEAWFRERGITASFVGHPLFDRAVPQEAVVLAASGYPQGSPRIALLPGSRPGEIAKNWPLLLGAYRALVRSRPGVAGMVAATTPAVAERVRGYAEKTGGWPESLTVAVGATDSVVYWSELALVVSGTVTLQIARQRRPMIIVYKSSPLLYLLLAKWVLSTEFLTLPNLVAGREVVPEFVPHFAGHEAIVEEAQRLIDSPEIASRQRGELGRIVEQFTGHHAGVEAAEAILVKLGLAPGVVGAGAA